jgi:hypothetical protein
MRSIGSLVLAGAVLAGVPQAALARPLTRAERIEAQRAIEGVYWSHRTWPAVNPGPKPPLSAVVSDAALVAKVEDYLAKSRALGEWWLRPITGEQLQAELDRMAARTRDARVLGALFAALGNDPDRIAETLVRQTLADRLVRSWYAGDSRFHGRTRAKAEAALAACADTTCMPSLGGDYRETTWRLREGGAGAAASVDLDAPGWQALHERLGKALGAEPHDLPLGTPGGIQETAGGFVVTAVLSRDDEEITTATVVWPKEPFDAWWTREREGLDTDVEPAAGPFHLPSAAASVCEDDTWSPTYLDMPDPHGGYTAVWTGTEMIVWGGTGSIGGRYNPSTDTWTLTSATNAPTQRTAHTAVWTGTHMIVWGGAGLPAGDLNTGGRYDPVMDTWLPTGTGATPPAGRRAHTAVWTGTQMIVWGGYSAGLEQNTGGRYTPATDSWTATSTGANVPAARRGHTAVWTGTYMVVWGGADAANTPLDTGGRYNPATDAWLTTSTAGANPDARLGHTAVWSGSVMVVWGGYDSGSIALNTGGRYNPSTNAWSATSTAANVPAARYNHSAVWTGSVMIVWGGWFPTNTGGRYNPSTNAWTATSTGANVPSARASHVAVWTGTEMIVWGGNEINSGAPGGGRYAPATDTWVAISGGGVPEARFNHAAVWTGAEMIVWGGIRDGFNEYDTGGRYTPATDSWVPTSTGANVPQARYWPAALWTGTEMVVWGGAIDNNGAFLNTGGRYAPATDTWAPTSTGAGVPDGRVWHTGVWTGTEMIVWGGWNGTSLDSGGRYAPSGDSWTATPGGASLPTARYQHTAVWTGTEMIVWGGTTSGGTTNAGGRYVPSAGTWAPTSNGVDVPTARIGHSAVWTGSEMIVWGGGPGNGSFVNTGGRYAPSSDSWVPTPTGAGAPTARGAHTAVWTGAEMVVWGGISFGTGYLNTGARYMPLTGAWTATSTGSGVPPPRGQHPALWTGAEMIVWGGYPATATGGVYCACGDPLTVYRDLDGDGHGDPAGPALSCDGSVPGGYAASATDCDDSSAAAHPGAAELCNDADDDCNDVVDDGFAVPGSPLLELDASGPLWSSVAPSTGYDVVRGGLVLLVSTSGDFEAATAECLAGDVPDTSLIDADLPPAGDAFWFLVRAVNCTEAGTWDSGGPAQQGSRDAEIADSAGACR